MPPSHGPVQHQDGLPPLDTTHGPLVAPGHDIGRSRGVVEFLNEPVQSVAGKHLFPGDAVQEVLVLLLQLVEGVVSQPVFVAHDPLDPPGDKHSGPISDVEHSHYIKLL